MTNDADWTQDLPGEPVETNLLSDDLALRREKFGCFVIFERDEPAPVLEVAVYADGVIGWEGGYSESPRNAHAMATALMYAVDEARRVIR